MNDILKKARNKRRKHQQQAEPISIQQKEYSELILAEFEETIEHCKSEQSAESKRDKLEQLKSKHQEVNNQHSLTAPNEL
ncbi:hypothetical protein [Vibrio sonorensis]|uniref:hypothetical protein n=1 Tax=Vibrio sonorensis TaxID=1004316 RepID=UPI0008DADDDD|nr:hypothetical protein [Vibrio sonorensis]